MSELKYKVGDRVKIKSLKWYNENKDEYGYVDAGVGLIFDEKMSRWCGKTMTILNVYQTYYTMEEDYISQFYWRDDMIEGLAEEEIEKDMEEHQKICDEIMTIQGIEPIEAEIEEIWHCPDGCIFKDENGNVINATKIILEKVNTLKIQSNNMETETHRGYYTTEEETTNKSKKV